MNNSLACILIDDELNNINLLRRMIQKFCPNVNIIGEETDPLKAQQLILDLQPDLVFLDIEMPNMNGFQLLKQLEPIQFEVIFVTAYTEYAIEAFDHHAIGYITKPVDAEKLISAIHHVANRIQHKMSNESIIHLLESRFANKQEIKIPLNTLNGMIFINEEDIMYCESSGSYTHFFLVDGRKIVVSKSIGEYEKILPETNFVRIHDKYIVNLKYIIEYIKGRGGEIILTNAVTLPVSVNRKEILMAHFDKWLKK